MQVELTEVDSSATQRKIVLERLPVTIGQSPDAEIHLDHHWVSRQHCEISVMRDTLVVRDLGSMLGTFVNGLNVTTANLMPGDKLTVGSTSFLVDYERRNGTRRARGTRRQRRAAPEDGSETPPLAPGNARPTPLEPSVPANGRSHGALPRLLSALFHLRLALLRRKPR
jgi:pSer/pThr/pTyr-binding forkhead associated (FHA) protein